MNLENLQVYENLPLKEALISINLNKHGLILIKNSNESIIGIATDGDIREKLLNGATLSDPIGDLANKNFTWADTTTSKEFLLKK